MKKKIKPIKTKVTPNFHIYFHNIMTKIEVIKFYFPGYIFEIIEAHRLLAEIGLFDVRNAQLKRENNQQNNFKLHTKLLKIWKHLDNLLHLYS